MLRQNINLLELVDKGKVSRYNVSFKQFVILNIIFNLIMLIMLYLSFAQEVALKKEAATLTAELKQKETTFLALKSKFPSFFFEKNSNAENEIKNAIELSNQLLQELGNKIVFSEVFLSLSQDITNDVWLTKIELSNNEDNMTITGKSYSIKQLDQFINNIKKDTKLAAYSVNVNRIERVGSKNELVSIEFEINLINEHKV